jgi:two-component system, sensor histidine kinase YesM
MLQKYLKGTDAMLKQYKTFYNILLMILISTLIVMAMYTLTINTSLKTVREDIQANNLNRMRFIINGLDNNVRQLSMLATALETDSKIALLQSVEFLETYDQVKLIQDLTDKMRLQSFSEGWVNQIAVYSPSLLQWIGTSRKQETPPPTFAEGNRWTFEPQFERLAFYRNHEEYVIRVTFPLNNLRDILDRALIDNNDPFFYHPNYHVISNREDNTERQIKVLNTLAPRFGDSHEGTEIVNVNGMDYMVNYLRSESLDWYMIDYLPLNEALRPIERTKSFFYLACVMLFAGGVVTALFLYKKVQVPIVTLLKAVRLLKRGDFTVRIRGNTENEFDFLYENFNDMAAQIEDLIEKVYKEKIVSREALVKQLQAQINPHFLYNCLFFINNMNRLGNEEAVTAMTQNLAEYFRYTTRLDEPFTTLEKELGVVENYLTIQSLRMSRLRYEINIPDDMKGIPVPKLLIQPLVENSVIHGIEKKQSAGFIRITGEAERDVYRITVEDDGKGMTQEAIDEMLHRMTQPLDDTMGCALWNIGQRMQLHFEGPASMEIGPSDLGGLCVTLSWPINRLLEV